MQLELLLLFESLLLFELLMQLELLLLVELFEFFYLVTQFMQSSSDNKPSVIRSCVYMLFPRKKATSHIQILHTDLFSIAAANDVGNRCRFIEFVFFLNVRKNDFIAQATGNMVELFCSKATHVIASY